MSRNSLRRQKKVTAVLFEFFEFGRNGAQRAGDRESLMTILGNPLTKGVEPSML